MSGVFVTDEENHIIDILGEAATRYKRLLKEDDARQGVLRDYPWDEAEFVAHIHDLQARVMARATSRAFPERFRPI